MVAIEREGLGCTVYIYLIIFQDMSPDKDLREFLCRCCSLVYQDLGKTMSGRGGLRVTSYVAIGYASWNNAREQPLPHCLP